MAGNLSRVEAEERAAFVARKLVQAQRALIAGGGISFRRTGDTFRLGVDNGNGLIESVIIGRPRRVSIVPEGRMQGIKRKSLAVIGIKVRSTDKRNTDAPIDLSDEQVDDIVARWTAGESAYGLKFARAK